jgi:hypothetical protein
MNDLSQARSAPHDVKRWFASRAFWAQGRQAGLHQRLNPIHWEHHEKPFDGWHISGELKDILPLFVIFSFLFPVYNLPSLLAGVVQSYVSEEWLHYFPAFRKVSQSLLSISQAVSSVSSQPAEWKWATESPAGFWDVVFHTGYPKPVRRLLFVKRPRHAHQEDDALRSFETFRERLQEAMTRKLNLEIPRSS